MNSLKGIDRLILKLAVFIIVFSVITVYIGIQLYEDEKRTTKDEINSQLSGLSSFKVNSIISWLGERNSDAELLFENKELNSYLRYLILHPADTSVSEKIRLFLKPLKDYHEYAEISIINSRGNMLFAYSGDIKEIGNEIFKEAVNSLNLNRILYSKIKKDNTTGNLFIDYYIPVRFNKNNFISQSAVIIMQIDPHKKFFPIIKRWPAKSKSAESYIVRVDDNYVTFLSRLNHVKVPPLKYKLNTDSSTGTIYRFAAEGKTGIVEGQDYRGVPVLADIRIIPKTSWLIISQVDREEIYSPIYIKAFLFYSIIIFLLILAVVSNVLIWKFHKSKAEKKELESKLEKQALIKHFDYLMKYSGDIFVMTDENKKIILANDAAVNAYGYSREELVGMAIHNLRNRNEYRAFINRFKDVEVAGEVIFEISHVRKNKEIFPAEETLRLINIENRKFYQSSARDITERKSYQRKLENMNRVYAVLSNINELIVRIHDKESIMEQLCSIAVEDGNFRMVWIGMYNESTYSVSVAAHSGYNSNYLEKLEISLDDNVRGSGPTGKCIKTGIHQICNDILSDKNMLPWRENAVKNNYRSSAAFPITVFGKVIGVINFYSEEVNFFDFEEVKLLDELASDLSFALEFTENERRRSLADASLKKSEERFKQLARLLPQTVFETDLELNLKFLNKTGKELFGLERFNPEAKINIKDLTIQNDHWDMEKYFNDFLRGLRSQTKEFTVIDKEGRLLYVNIYINLIHENGKPVGFRGLLIDNTLQKETEKEILKSREQYQSIFEEILTGNFISKVTGELITCNSAYLSLFNFKDFNEAKNFNQNNLFVTAEERNKLFMLLKEKRKISNYELELRNKDGKQLFVIENLSGNFDQYGNLTQVKGYIIDITQKKIIEEQIKLQARMLDSVGQAVTSINTGGKIIYWNKSAEDLYGLKREDIINTNIYKVGPSIFPNWKTEEIYKLFVTGENRAGEVSVKKTDGNFIPVFIINSPVFNSSGNLIGMVNIATNLTEQKKKEEELLAAKEKAEEMNRLKSNFLANMSHELRTPMIGILGYSEILSEELNENAHKEMVKSIRDSGNRLMKTLNFLLDLSRIESNKDEISLELLNLNRIILNVVKNYEGYAKKKRLYLKYAFKEKNISAFLDEKIVVQILDNLINNALKFTDYGGVTVETGYEEIDNSGWIKIKIADTGIGIPKKYHETIFEEFRQVSEGINRGYEGSGLGLTITRKSVEILSGKILVESEVNRGSTFTVMFPALKAFPDKELEDEVTTKIEIPAGVTKSKKRILLVDNDTTTVDYIGVILDKYYEFDAVLDGNSAVEKASRNKYALILMDIGLGLGIDGIRTAEIIRKLPGYENIPVIAITAFAMKGDKEVFLSKGMSDYLSKPFQIGELLNVIKKNLEQG